MDYSNHASSSTWSPPTQSPAALVGESSCLPEAPTPISVRLPAPVDEFRPSPPPTTMAGHPHLSPPRVRTHSPVVLRLVSDPNNINRRLPSLAVASMYGYRIPYYHPPRSHRHIPRTHAAMAVRHLSAASSSSQRENPNPGSRSGLVIQQTMVEAWRRDLESRTLEYIELPAASTSTLRPPIRFSSTVNSNQPQTSNQTGQQPGDLPAFPSYNNLVNAISEACSKNAGYFCRNGLSSTDDWDNLRNKDQIINPRPLVIRDVVHGRDSQNDTDRNRNLQIVPYRGGASSSNPRLESISSSDDEQEGNSTDSEATVSVDLRGLYNVKIEQGGGEEEINSEEVYDGRIHSRNHPVNGPYQCPKCEAVLQTSQQFAAHVVSAHYKNESRREKRLRRISRYRRFPNLGIFKTRHGVTLASSEPSWEQVPVAVPVGAPTPASRTNECQEGTAPAAMDTVYNAGANYQNPWVPGQIFNTRYGLPFGSIPSWEQAPAATSLGAPTPARRANERQAMNIVHNAGANYRNPRVPGQIFNTGYGVTLASTGSSWEQVPMAAPLGASTLARRTNERQEETAPTAMNIVHNAGANYQNPRMRGQIFNTRYGVTLASSGPSWGHVPVAAPLGAPTLARRANECQEETAPAAMNIVHNATANYQNPPVPGQISSTGYGVTLASSGPSWGQAPVAAPLGAPTLAIRANESQKETAPAAMNVVHNVGANYQTPPVPGQISNTEYAVTLASSGPSWGQVPVAAPLGAPTLARSANERQEETAPAAMNVVYNTGANNQNPQEPGQIIDPFMRAMMLMGYIGQVEETAGRRANQDQVQSPGKENAGDKQVLLVQPKEERE